MPDGMDGMALTNPARDWSVIGLCCRRRRMRTGPKLQLHRPLTHRRGGARPDLSRIPSIRGFRCVGGSEQAATLGVDNDCAESWLGLHETAVNGLQVSGQGSHLGAGRLRRPVVHDAGQVMGVEAFRDGAAETGVCRGDGVHGVILGAFGMDWLRDRGRCSIAEPRIEAGLSQRNLETLTGISLPIWRHGIGA